MSRRAIAILGAKVALSVALLWLVLSKVDAGSIIVVLAKADPWLVALWYCLVPVVIALSAWRWEILAPGVDFRMAFKYTWIGVFFGHVLPGSISGDVAKGVSLALKDTTARAGLAASIVAEKVIGLAALVVFFDMACVLVYMLHGAASPEMRNLALIGLVISLAGAGSALAAAWISLRTDLLAAHRLRGFPGRLAEGIASAARFYRSRPWLLLKAFLISMAIHVVNIVATYLSFMALRVDAGWLLASVIYPVVSVLLLIPISVSGIGVRDATLAMLFTLFGLSAASGVAISWLNFLTMIPNVFIGGAIQVMEMYRKK